MEYFVLFNPKAGNGWNDELKQSVANKLDSKDLIFKDITEVDYSEFFEEIEKDSKIVLVGGDGTLNRFINDTDSFNFDNEIYYIANGSGNDFLNDIKHNVDENKPVLVNKFFENLPVVTVKGETKKFLNGIGYGIDGYCCEEGDKAKAKSDKAVNYTAIAIKGLLYAFKPRNAKITVDGVTKEYKKVWLAPSMNGRFFGGGMMPTPDQDRLNAERKISLLVWHGTGKLKTLMHFPKIFEGTHTQYKKSCVVIKGKEIEVEFDKPCALQIDGETVLNVKGYKAVSAKVKEKVKN